MTTESDFGASFPQERPAEPVTRVEKAPSSEKLTDMVSRTSPWFSEATRDKPLWYQLYIQRDSGEFPATARVGEERQPIFVKLCVSEKGDARTRYALVFHGIDERPERVDYGDGFIPRMRQAASLSPKFKPATMEPVLRRIEEPTQ